MNIISRIHNMLIAMPYGLEKMLELMDVVESTDVPTACVPVGGKPKIIINPEYVRDHCETDYKLFMLIQHELHHILLGHTRLFKRVTREHNIAFDAIINAMLCRSQPDDQWTALFRDSYAANLFPYCLLRPPVNFPDPGEFVDSMPGEVKRLIHTLYYSNQGTFLEVFELIHQIIDDARRNPEKYGVISSETLDDVMDDLLGSHGEDHRGLESTDDPELFQAVREIVEEWPQPPDPIKGRSLNDVLREEQIQDVTPHTRAVSKILKAIVQASRSGDLNKGRHAAIESRRMQQFLPSRDRRAFAVQCMGELIPIFEAQIPYEIHRRNQVVIYIDVSGSMAGYVSPLLKAVQLVHQRIPVQMATFSTEVQMITVQDIARGRYDTTGGTDGDCIWQHIEDNQVQSAVVLTDGYLGAVSTRYHHLKSQCHIECVLTPNGWTQDVEAVVSGLSILNLI